MPGFGHNQLIEYATLREDDVVSFEFIEAPLQRECNWSEATFLRLKK